MSNINAEATPINPETINGEIQFLALSQLCESDLNVRKSALADMESLTTSIEQIGLQQNLIVVPFVKGKKKGQFGVIAGRRRFQALNQLASSENPNTQKLLNAIPCKVISADDAILVSLSENLHRQQMTPVDTFNSVKALLDLGKGLSYIVRNLCKSENTIKQYIALANLSPKLIALFQEDEVTLEQMQALTCAQTHEHQEQIWEEYGYRNPHPNYIKKLIMGDGVGTVARSPLYQFIGVEEYEKRGGSLTPELFGEDIFIHNHALMLQLFEEKAQPLIDNLKAQGWSWIHLEESLDYSATSPFQLIPALQRPKTKEQLDQLAELEANKEGIQSAQNELEDPDDADSEQYQILEEKLEAINEEINAIERSCEYFTEEVMALAGGFVYIENGKLASSLGFAKKENIAQLKKVLQSSQDTAESANELVSPKAEKPKSAHSEALTKRLYAEKTVALQWEVVSNQAVALATLAYPLVKQFFYPRTANSFPLRLSIEGTSHALLQANPLIEQSIAHQELAKLHDEWVKRLPKKEKDLFAHLQTLEPLDILALLSYCAVQGINGLSGSESHDPLKELAKTVNLDMKKYWKPTADSYFKSVSMAQISAVAKEAGLKELGAQIEGKKKAEAVAIAEKALADSGWLPKVLRS